MQFEIKKISKEVREEQESLLKELMQKRREILKLMGDDGHYSMDNPRSSCELDELRGIEYMIGQVKEMIATSKVVEREHAADGKIDFGDIVICHEAETNQLVKFQISEKMEIPNVASDIRKVTKQAPIGKALDGKKAGDIVTVTIPQGRWGGTQVRTLQILEVIQENAQEKQPAQE